MVKQIFVNLPVKNLEKTKEFFSKLGFSFNPQFTDQNAAALVLNDEKGIYAMLLTEEFFKTFVKKDIADATKTTEVINAIGVESKEEVDQLLEKAIANGGTKVNETYDYGWMYGGSFYDIDGHAWEVTYIDEQSIPADPAASVNQ